MKKKTKRILLIVDVFLLLFLIVGIVFLQKKVRDRDAQQIDPEELSYRYANTVQYQGEEVPLNRNLSSVLLIGTDNYIDDAKQNHIEAFYNQNLADFLVVLVFDRSHKTVTPFQICRDSMCDVPWLSVNGKVGGTVFEQITLAHSFGSGKEDSCINTRNAVQELLCGVPIDRYLAFTMDAVPLLNDLVGGVTVTLEDDVPALGADYIKGAAITLRGSEALRFVRYRDLELLDSNLPRMARHRLYLEAFTAAAREALAQNPDLATDAFQRIEPFLCTDLSVENVSDMVDDLCSYEILPVVTPEGEYVMGEQYAEFYVDDTSLWECVRTVFCS